MSVVPVSACRRWSERSYRGRSRASIASGSTSCEACDTDVEEAPFRIAVDWRGERREASGVARLEHFDVIALDFALRRTDDGSLRLVAPVEEGKAKSQ